MSEAGRWELFKERLIIDQASGFSLDTSRLNYDNAYLERLEPKARQAFAAMERLESGAISNPDEKRMVGHY
jgi:glucose-6-phosphate isomerase